MEFCRVTTCPFTDCENHQKRAPFGFAYTEIPMDKDCKRLADYLAAEAAKQDRIRHMTYGKAFAILRDIKKPDTPDEVKGAAIRKVILEMETHNAVTKDIMVNVIRYLFNLCFEETEG